MKIEAIIIDEFSQEQYVKKSGITEPRTEHKQFELDMRGRSARNADR